MRAHSAATFAGENGTDLQLLNANFFNRCGDLFVDQLIRFHDLFLRHRIDHGFAADAADDSGREINHFFVPFVDGANGDAVGRAAINFVDDYVLRSVDQLSREITRVSGLERGISETLTGAVSGDEILEHAEAFAEVRSDRAFDDLARGFGH